MLPVELAYAVKLRLKSNVLPATEVYDVVHSVTMADPDLDVAGILSNSCVILRYPPEDPEAPVAPGAPEVPEEPEVPDVPEEPEIPDDPGAPCKLQVEGASGPGVFEVTEVTRTLKPPPPGL